MKLVARSYTLYFYGHLTSTCKQTVSTSELIQKIRETLQNVTLHGILQQQSVNECQEWRISTTMEIRNPV